MASKQFQITAKRVITDPSERARRLARAFAVLEKSARPDASVSQTSASDRAGATQTNEPEREGSVARE